MISRAVPLLVLSLAACAVGGDHAVESPHYRYPAGATLTLNRAIEIPPGHATLWLQFGKAVARNMILTPEPHCGFEIDTVSAYPQPVAPDRFEIVKARRSVVVSGNPARFRPASFDADGPSFMFYQTEFFLHSARQPQVRMLTCTSNQNMPGVPIMRHLTLAEIRSALGEHFSLDIPAQAGH